MEALRGFVLSTMETTLIQGEKSRDPGPNCYLSRASSNTGLTDAFEADGLILPMPLKDELELIKSQMQAQAQAFEALSHSLSLLEQESGQQQQKIQHLEEELRRTGPERLERTLEQQLQELRLALSRELEAAQGQHRDPLDGLAEDVMQSKKLLCEELELVQGEMRRIHQKLDPDPAESPGGSRGPGADGRQRPAGAGGTEPHLVPPPTLPGTWDPDPPICLTGWLSAPSRIPCPGARPWGA
ncbi:coiled-coil domain-containing protein 159 isoform X7 [Alligator mississippiensis]|uniref:coiled-coil domain-containing protein 159 isoform X7 n=1 Tax=Alligator mississippiensis TaxID=8496 RepID=UPI0028777F29|nr:coiled-coil domain-containing protein 159 isoform X7 [Alligator mississippiensis]